MLRDEAAVVLSSRVITGVPGVCTQGGTWGGVPLRRRRAGAYVPSRWNGLPMLKICPSCHRTFSGGRTCMRCEGVSLLDVADPRTRVHLRSRSLQHTINTYYGARTAMLLLFAGLMLGAVLAVLAARQALLGPPAWRPVWLGAGAVGALGSVALALLAGSRLVHLFSAVCRGRPPSIDDLRAELRAGRARR